MTSKYYPEVEANPDFAKMEDEILAYWQQENLFHKSVESRPAKDAQGKNNEYIFYDGPPFANGLPHNGHILTGYIKDLYARYETMKGKRVERRFGWDCHGLPAEMGAEKELGISGRIKITEFGIDKFNDHCRSNVMKYTNEWQNYVTRQGRWVDFKDDYRTMDMSYMESVLWAFKELYKKGLVYEQMRVLPYSWACETPLSHFETRMDNSYRQIADKSITVAFKLKSAPKSAPQGLKAYKILAWTTTPWTLPSNLALAVHSDLDYVAIELNGEAYILAQSSARLYAKELGLEEGASLPSFKGAELVGLTYEPLFDYFKDNPNSFRILDGDFVEEGGGTGIVHLAPGFGEDDQTICDKNNIPLVCPVDSGGKFTSEVPDFQGIQVFETIDPVIIKLKEKGLWIKTEQYLHNYPHCWRTDTPLIYKAMPSWYVEVTKFRDKMVKNNQQINWVPSHIKDGLFGKWLENARDWSISRNRFWGTPIPVWRSDDPKYPRIDVYGSVAELEADFGVKVTDLHRPFIDSLTRPNPDDPTGKSMMRRVEDVFDCWFESGSVPFAQVHYPFENKEWFETHFPADFIVEYVAQTRGWFYTLVILATALFDKPPFLNCICHGVILDEAGQKLSKRLNNYADPLDIFAKYGSDSLRFLMASSGVMRGHEMLIDKDGRMIRDTIRLSIKPIWNAYNFFTLYANADSIKGEYITTSNNFMDKYIFAKLKEMIIKVTSSLDGYDTPGACYAINDFTEILNNWYIRRNRVRFWKSEKDQDKIEAYNTLYTVLHVLCRVAAPILPFTTEEIFLGLNGGKKLVENSVHLALLPKAEEFAKDDLLATEMDRVREICTAALNIRNEENIRVRQPLQTLQVMGHNLVGIDKYIELIQDEVNVKQVSVATGFENIATLILKINFPVLGKRLPTKVKDIIIATKKNEWQKNADGTITVSGEVLQKEEFSLLLEPKDPKGKKALASNDAIVALDLAISDELKNEGIARDVVRALQQARKDADLNVSDRIKVFFDTSAAVNNAIKLFANYIQEQTLSHIDYEKLANYHFESDTKLEEETIKIYFTKV